MQQVPNHIIQTMKRDAPHKLVELFNDGSREAFAAIYEIQFASVLFISKQFVISHEDAEDITAETFLKLWKLRGNFETMEKIRAFLHTAARNACVDYLRHAKIKTEKKQHIMYSMQQNQSALSEHAMVINEFKKHIHHEIEKLPGKCPLICKMSFFEELKNEEIAALFHISEKTVRNLKAYALKRLRPLFQKLT